MGVNALSVKEDQIDSVKGGGSTTSVFDEEIQERRSWKFCGSRLQRSAAVYFTQILLELFLVMYLTKPVISKLDCGESTLWFSLLCAVGYALPNSKL